MFEPLDVWLWEFLERCAVHRRPDTPTNPAHEQKVSHDTAFAMIEAAVRGNFLWLVQLEMNVRYVPSRSDPLAQNSGSMQPSLLCGVTKYEGGQAIVVEIIDYRKNVTAQRLSKAADIPHIIQATLARTLVEFPNEPVDA